MPFFVYIVQNPEGRLYIGFTTDMSRRMHQHQGGEGHWTHRRGPWKLVHYETFTDRAEAMRREQNLKRGRPNQELRKRFSNSPG